MGILVRNGRIVSDGTEWTGDIHCREGKIVAAGANLDAEPGDEVIDASGCLVFPGGVDPHVHLALPVMGTVSADDFESGTGAALAGGTTTIVDFVHPERGEDLPDALRARAAEARDAACDYSFHMAVTWWGDGVAAGMARCVRAEGIPSFKVYMAYKDAVGLDDRELIRVFAEAGALDALVLVHAEHGDMVDALRDRLVAEGKTGPRYHALSRPSALEGEAAARAIVLASLNGARLYVVHVTCRESAAAVDRARADGLAVHGETCPHYLVLDDSVYEKPGFEAAPYVLSPPIRSKADQDALWDAVRSGVLEVVSTDHCPFDLRGQKDRGRDDFRLIPNGAAGIEHRLALLYTYGVRAGRLTLPQFVDLVATRPAKLFGLYPRKGTLSAGADADVVVWDPEATGTISAKTHHSRCDTSIYEGMAVRGAPAVVIAGGVVRFSGGALRAERGAGRFVRRALPWIDTTD